MRSAGNIAETSRAERANRAARFVARALDLCGVPPRVRLRVSGLAPRDPSRLASSAVLLVMMLVGCATSTKSVAPELPRGQNEKIEAAQGGVPIYRYARTGDLDGLRRLKEQGEPIDKLNSVGVTPLMMACRFGQLEAVKWFLNEGALASRADRDQQGPLHYALGSDAKDEVIRPLVALLIQKGADPFLPDQFGLTPIRVLIEENWLDVIKVVRFNENPKKQCDRMVLKPGEMSFAKQARRLDYKDLADYLDSIGCW